MVFHEVAWGGVEAQTKQPKVHARSMEMPFVILDALHFDMIVSTMVQSALQKRSDLTTKRGFQVHSTRWLGVTQEKGAGSNTTRVPQLSNNCTRVVTEWQADHDPWIRRCARTNTKPSCQ